jgi:hypothetical protein
MIDGVLVELLEIRGYAPFLDPLPEQEEDVFQILRSLLA